MKLSTVMPRSPAFGASVRPLRLRPPSMKYAIGNPLASIACRYSRNTAAYSGSPLKLRRRKKAPPRRSIGPTIGKFRLAPAAM